MPSYKAASLLTLYDISGTHIGHLGSDVRKKLKAAYTLVEQLYTGAQWIIYTASHNKPAPTLILDTLMKLSVLPARVEELKKSAARTGAINALTGQKLGCRILILLKRLRAIPA